MKSNIFEDYVVRDFSKLGRSNVISSNAMLASSHPLASSVGLEILKRSRAIYKMSAIDHSPEGGNLWASWGGLRPTRAGWKRAECDPRQRSGVSTIDLASSSRTLED